MRLAHGAFVFYYAISYNRDTKLVVCRILSERAKKDHATAVFMQVTCSRLRSALFDSGGCLISPREPAALIRENGHGLYHSSRKNLAICQQLVQVHQTPITLMNIKCWPSSDTTATTAFVAIRCCLLVCKIRPFFEYYFFESMGRALRLQNDGEKNE
jgi:hypothetical protein